MKNIYILAINPGSTSTKLAIYTKSKKIAQESIKHSSLELSSFKSIVDQKDFRTKIVLNFIKKNDKTPSDFAAIVGRGGLLTPLQSGTYRVTQEMVDYLAQNILEHASNLGAIIADDIAQRGKTKAYIVDPVVVDEMDEIAKITGLDKIKRRSIFHALNQKAAAREVAVELNKRYEDLNLIVAHLGGGISVGAHRRGLVIDVNNALNGDGPFTPERAGALPVWSLMELILSWNYSRYDLKKMITGQGGLVAHLGTNDLVEVTEKYLQGDKRTKLIFEAMAYNVAKEIAALSAVFKGDIDAVVLTGGIANNTTFINLVIDRIKFLAPVKILPGEDEMKSLAAGALRVLNKSEEEKIWKLEIRSKNNGNY
jgi:butyrate kinase